MRTIAGVHCEDGHGGIDQGENLHASHYSEGVLAGDRIGYLGLKADNNNIGSYVLAVRYDSITASRPRTTTFCCPGPESGPSFARAPNVA